MSNNVTFLSGNTRETLNFEGRSLIRDLLVRTNTGGLKSDFPCGGKKTCGKCAVKIKEGIRFTSAPSETEKKFLSEKDLAENIRYACMCEIFGDVTIEVEPEEANSMAIQTLGLQSANLKPDKFKKTPVKLAEAALENPLSDEDNLILSIEEATGEKVNRPNFNIIKKLPEINEKEFDVILCASGHGKNIIDIRKKNECADIYGAAVDIGTTTVAAYLYSLTSGRFMGVAAKENPQRAYGADVISRINYAIENESGLKILQNLARSLISELIGDLCAANGVGKDDVYSVVLTGNTVMQHIAAGLSPKNIAFTPFTAVSLFGFEITAKEFGDICVNENAPVYFPPAFASYVGGDIAAGIIASDTDICDELRLFLDIGTNGEIGLGNKDSLVFCATAAGPAFEGAHIKLGMAGVNGAVNKIYLGEKNEIICETIGDSAPKGLCGSGIIDAVALMLEIGAIDETGRILESDEEDDMPEKYRNFSENLCENDGENVFVIDKKNNIYITQKDVREIMLAKAAVSAGIMTLLKYGGKTAGDIGELILAGGFGAHIDKKSACKIGLIPEELEDKIIIAGNTAGMGAVSVLLDNSAAGRIGKISGISKYIELSGDEFFRNEFVERMMF